MEKQYTVSDFYLFLQLDLWTRGAVSGWGKVELLSGEEAEASLLRKPPGYYQNLLLPKRLLWTGIYLLDAYVTDLTPGQMTTSILVVSIHSSGMENSGRLCFLKMTTRPDVAAIPPAAIKEKSAAIKEQSAVMKEKIISESLTSYRKKRKK
jgi:hypothetical protein